MREISRAAADPGDRLCPRQETRCRCYRHVSRRWTLERPAAAPAAACRSGRRGRAGASQAPPGAPATAGPLPQRPSQMALPRAPRARCPQMVPLPGRCPLGSLPPLRNPTASQHRTRSLGGRPSARSAARRRRWTWPTPREALRPRRLRQPLRARAWLCRAWAPGAAAALPWPAEWSPAPFLTTGRRAGEASFSCVACAVTVRGGW